MPFRSHDPKSSLLTPLKKLLDHKQKKMVTGNFDGARPIAFSRTITAFDTRFYRFPLGRTWQIRVQPFFFFSVFTRCGKALDWRFVLCPPVHTDETWRQTETSRWISDAQGGLMWIVGVGKTLRSTRSKSRGNVVSFVFCLYNASWKIQE